jgi:hypothetical protein
MKFATARKEPITFKARENASIEKRLVRQRYERVPVQVVLPVISAWVSLDAPRD